MQVVMEDSEYSYVASTKIITLASPYNALSIGQIIRIADLTTGSVFYESKTQKHPISISGADITHTYDDDNDADADKLQIVIDIGGHALTPIYGTVLPPEMLHKELRVSTTAQQVSITPASGKRIRVFAVHASQMVPTQLTSTLRASLSFGTGGVSDPDKVLASYRQSKAEDTEAADVCAINVVGDTDETVTLTNVTFSNGTCITRAVVYYSVEN